MSIATQLQDLPSVQALRDKGIVIDEQSLYAVGDDLRGDYEIRSRFVRADEDGRAERKAYPWSLRIPFEHFQQGLLVPQDDYLAGLVEPVSAAMGS